MLRPHKETKHCSPNDTIKLTDPFTGVKFAIEGITLSWCTAGQQRPSPISGEGPGIARS